LGVLFDGKHWEFKCCLELRVCHISILETETHRANESFVLWRFTSEVFSDEADLVDSTFPTFSLSFSRADNFEHLGLTHGLNLLYWH
jgi:hypothetical protein